MRYRIYIPALDPEGVNMTLDVEADNWMVALRNGLDEIGADRDLVKRATCEIKPDKTIRVVEPEHGRVFVLRELPDPPGGSTGYTQDALDAETVPFLDKAPAISTAPIEKETSSSSPRRTISHLHLSRISRDQLLDSASEPVSKTRSQARAEAATDLTDDDIISDLFDGLGNLAQVSDSIEATLQYALELLMEKVPSMAGWLLLADINRRDLYVAMASGPKAEQVIRYRLPLGRGIAGFCAANSVSIALNDVERDPRFQMSLSRSVGLDVASVACAPIEHEGRVYGALQLVNHLSQSEFSPREQEGLTYAATRIGEYLVHYAMVDAIA